MSSFLSQTVHRAEIYFMLAHRPDKLFQRLNELGWYKNTLHAWIDDLSLDQDANGLDIGCATGVLTEYMATRAHYAIGVDASKKMISAALQNQRRRAEYQLADATFLPFKDADFNMVVSASLLNIVSNPVKMAAEMARVCKYGGTVSVMVPKQGISDAQIAELTRTCCPTGFSAAALSVWHKRAPKMKPADIESLLHAAGLNISATRDYLDGMLVSVSAIKVEDSPRFAHGVIITG